MQVWKIWRNRNFESGDITDFTQDFFVRPQSKINFKTGRVNVGTLVIPSSQSFSISLPLWNRNSLSISHARFKKLFVV